MNNLVSFLIELVVGSWSTGKNEFCYGHIIAVWYGKQSSLCIHWNAIYIKALLETQVISKVFWVNCGLYNEREKRSSYTIWGQWLALTDACCLLGSRVPQQALANLRLGSILMYRHRAVGTHTQQAGECTGIINLWKWLNCTSCWTLCNGSRTLKQFMYVCMFIQRAYVWVCMCFTQSVCPCLTWGRISSTNVSSNIHFHDFEPHNFSNCIIHM